VIDQFWNLDETLDTKTREWRNTNLRYAWVVFVTVMTGLKVGIWRAG
jgi:hypothetical protein